MLDRRGVVVYRRTGGPDDIDAIDQYSRRLVGALSTTGLAARYEPGGLSAVLRGNRRPAWLLLQYNPFRYGRAGFAPGLVAAAVRLKLRCVPLAVMVHEGWVEMADPRTALIGAWQRVQLRALLRLADAVMTSTESLATEIGRAAVHVPVAANIEPQPRSPKTAREPLGLDRPIKVALLGRGHPSRALDHAEAAIAALARAHSPEKVGVLNLGADAPPLRVPPGVAVISPGAQDERELSNALSASDVVLLPLIDGVSTRRSSLMAALAHGRPVVGLIGKSTDALLADAEEAVTLTRAGDSAEFAQASVDLAGDPERMRSTGEAGRRLYESQFDWPVLARRVGEVLEGVRRPRQIVFVAGDVGKPGGMEHQSAQLVSRLLTAGYAVTVVARTCSLPEHARLRFRRVRTPRRPFALAYPAFFIAASLVAARRRGALLHTTGAIIANRADLSTVHYCHRSAVTRVDSRASRAGVLYKLNAAAAKLLSLAGERWCYRPQRTGVLCAVSNGVARELEDGFPTMRGAIRTVPNGVDLSAFAPDTEARARLRRKLRIENQASVAVFVGGDWQRKGLRHVVDALLDAPQWHLLVAGTGDSRLLVEQARDAGTATRLHILGHISETPALYAAADAFVLPTAYEAFPLVALEAAATGLPLLVTRVNGVEDLLEHGRNGWFIERDGSTIAQRLEQLRADPGSARRMGEASRSAAARYSWESMAAEYHSIYSKLT